MEDTSQFKEDFAITTKRVMTDVFSKLMLNILKNEITSYLPFLPEKMKWNLHDIDIYVNNIINWKQALNHGLILKKVHKVIKFNQKTWLKPYIDMNTKLIQKVKNNFEKDFLQLMNNATFAKTMEDVRTHRNIKLVTTERRRNYLV